MFGLATRLIGGLFTPLIDKFSASSARLLRKLALFVVAAVAMGVVLIALTIAFDLWIASMAGPIVGALAVAGLYLVVALMALWFALRPPRTRVEGAKAAKDRPTGAKDSPREKGLDSQIDDFAEPLLGLLQRLGLRREQLAVLAGTSVAKQLGPIPLVGLAIVAGFLIGRMWDGWRALLSTDALATILSTGLFNRGGRDADEDDRGASA